MKTGYKADFSVVEERLGKEGADALARLYDYYGKDWIDWLGGLYDPSTGAFYYSPSARDNEGFLPDVESTAQTLYLVSSTGMMNHLNHDYVKAYPREMRERLGEFIRSMQSDDDGYFYHKQWGNKIGSSRKGRDNTQSLSLLRDFGYTPLYPTAEQRLKALSESKAEKKNDSVFAKHLLSKEAMLEYLEKLSIGTDSHSFGHIMSSQGSQIKAAGLADFVIDYVDKRQLADSGLWENAANYSTMSGVIKVSALYSSLGSRLKHSGKIIRSAIDVILSDEDPIYITYVFNPWGALGTAMRSADAESRDGVGDDYEALFKEVRAAFPAMIDKTIEKLGKFRKPGGSYSYEQPRSAPTTQGVPVSLGEFEGDVNGLACGLQYTIGGIFSALGLPRVKMCDEGDFEHFLDYIRNSYK